MRHCSPAGSYRQCHSSAAVLLPAFVVKVCKANLTGAGVQAGTCRAMRMIFLPKSCETEDLVIRNIAKNDVCRAGLGQIAKPGCPALLSLSQTRYKSFLRSQITSRSSLCLALGQRCI